VARTSNDRRKQVAIVVLDRRTAYDPAPRVVVEVQDANQALRTSCFISCAER
jgi:hypothetical protein